MLSTPPKLQIYMQKMCGQCRLHTYISREVQGIYIYAEKCRKVGPMQPFNEILRTVDIYLIGVRTNKRNVYPSRGRLKTTTNVCTSICNTHPRKVLYDLKSSAVIRIQTERNGKP